MQTRHCAGDDPARIAIVTNAQGFVIADHLHLPILKAWVVAGYNSQDGARPALPNFPFSLLFSYLCIMRTVCV
jgi:hypothetical protein